MAKKQSYYERRQKDQVNKKAIYWTVGVLVAIVVIVTALMIFNI